MQNKLRNYDSIPVTNTSWLTADALKLMTYFGKAVGDTSGVEVNSVHNPVLFKYYIKGTEFNENYYE